MCLLKAYECNIVVLIYSLDELTNCEIESPPKHQRLPLFKSRNRPLGGGFLLFRPTDDGSDTARGPGWRGGGGEQSFCWPIRGGGGGGGGGGPSSPYDGLYGEAPPERGTFLKL